MALSSSVGIEAPSMRDVRGGAGMTGGRVFGASSTKGVRGTGGTAGRAVEAPNTQGSVAVGPSASAWDIARVGNIFPSCDHKGPSKRALKYGRCVFCAMRSSRLCCRSDFFPLVSKGLALTALSRGAGGGSDGTAGAGKRSGRWGENLRRPVPSGSDFAG